MEGMEAAGGIEPPYKGFADLCLTAWLRRRGGIRKPHSSRGSLIRQGFEKSRKLPEKGDQTGSSPAPSGKREVPRKPLKTLKQNSISSIWRRASSRVAPQTVVP